MTETDPELEPFSKFIDAIEPWLDEVVVIGGWSHRLYRLHPLARKLDYLPLTTLDGDVAVPPKLKTQDSTVRQRLLQAGFQEEFVGEDKPPVTHYHYGTTSGFYAEFLAPLVGSEYDRRKKRKATTEVAGISSQLLRYIDVLMISPWKVALSKQNGYPLSSKRNVRIANPTSFLVQKILIHSERGYEERAKDLLYIHDTIDVFSERLDELRRIFEEEVSPKLHAKRRKELEDSAESLFGKVGDASRKASQMSLERRLSPERIAESSVAGLREIFERSRRGK